MKIIRHASELGPAARKVCIAIGFFDGVHLGHQQILRQTIEDAHQHEAASVAITFDRHPNAVVAPGRTPPLIYSLAQKLRVIAALGIDATLVVQFDRAFSQQTGDAFIRALVRDFGQVESLCVGSAFAFGHRRSGNIQLLKKLGQELRFIVHGLAAVSLDGNTVSSTRIRNAIGAGDLDDASQMLGRTYSLAGTVVRGDQLGQQLGFPTANLDITGLVLPPKGVYAVHAMVGGQTHRAVLNIGVRPTLNQPVSPLQVEAHLLDFSGDLYGAEMEIEFMQKLREERSFASRDDLREQIQRDIAAARALF
ncbi:MAG: bifunctional riboflavin kinase/FAD synthetase [Limisphaerales bacterium]